MFYWSDIILRWKWWFWSTKYIKHLKRRTVSQLQTTWSENKHYFFKSRWEKNVRQPISLCSLSIKWRDGTRCLGAGGQTRWLLKVFFPSAFSWLYSNGIGYTAFPLPLPTELFPGLFKEFAERRESACFTSSVDWGLQPCHHGDKNRRKTAVEDHLSGISTLLQLQPKPRALSPTHQLPGGLFGCIPVLGPCLSQPMERNPLGPCFWMHLSQREHHPKGHYWLIWKEIEPVLSGIPGTIMCNLQLARSLASSASRSTGFFSKYGPDWWYFDDPSIPLASLWVCLFVCF